MLIVLSEQLQNWGCEQPLFIQPFWKSSHLPAFSSVMASPWLTWPNQSGWMSPAPTGFSGNGVQPFMKIRPLLLRCFNRSFKCLSSSTTIYWSWLWVCFLPNSFLSVSSPTTLFVEWEKTSLVKMAFFFYPSPEYRKVVPPLQRVFSAFGAGSFVLSVRGFL